MSILLNLNNEDPQTREKIIEIVRTIDLSDSLAISRYGQSHQTSLQGISHTMMDGLGEKTNLEASDKLANMVCVIKGFSMTKRDGRIKQAWWEKILGLDSPFEKLIKRYEITRAEIDKIAETLLRHEHNLRKDIKTLDVFYKKTLEFYDKLCLYVEAGELKVIDFEKNDLAKKRLEIEQETNSGKKMKFSEELSAMMSSLETFKKRLHDLKLTRQVAMQTLPSIRMVQENDDNLAAKIKSTLNNTIPLWERQMSHALAIHRSTTASKDLDKASVASQSAITQNNRILRHENENLQSLIKKNALGDKSTNDTSLEDKEKINALADRFAKTMIELSRESSELAAKQIADSLDAARDSINHHKEAKNNLQHMT